MNLFEYKWHGVINVGLPNLGILTCCKDLCTTTRRLCFAQLLEKQMVHRIRNYSSQVDFWLLYPVGLSPIRPIWRLKKTRLFVFHDPPEPHEKNNENGERFSENGLCPDSWNPMFLNSFLICPSFCSYLLLLVSSFHCLVLMARQRMRVRFCTRKVPGRCSLQLLFDDCSPFQKNMNIHTMHER